MNGVLRDRWLAGVLSAALAVSFILCVVSDLSFGAALDQAGVAQQTTTGTVALGISWLVGHGLHGAAVVAVPFFFLTRSKVATGNIDLEQR
ncbi:MAG: hypothetical protein WA996_13075 [Candidatus Promineifilaceae bacterium]